MNIVNSQHVDRKNQFVIDVVIKDWEQKSYPWLKQRLLQPGFLNRKQLKRFLYAMISESDPVWLNQLLSTHDYLKFHQVKNLLLAACGQKGPDDQASREFVAFCLERFPISCFDANVEEGRTALNLAILTDRLETVELLLQHGASMDVPLLMDVAVKPQLTSSISIAIGRENCKMVALLLKYGANAKKARALLKRIIAHSDAEIMKLLFAAGFEYRFGVLLYHIHMNAVLHELGASPVHPVESLGHRYCKKTGLIRFLLMEIGRTVSDYCYDAIIESTGVGGFLTLAITYKFCLDFGRMMKWPMDFKDNVYRFLVNRSPILQFKSLQSTHADILKDLIRRTRSECMNADKMIQYLNQQTDANAGLEIPTLTNLSFDCVRHYIIARNGSKIEEAVDKLPLPKRIKEKICLADIDKRVEKACCLLKYRTG